MSAATPPSDAGGVRDVQRIGAGELRAFIADAGEIQKGTLLFDSGGLSNLARHQNKLFCDAKGTSPAPYKVSIVYSGAPEPGLPTFKARCSCPAARTVNKPFCKHAAALLVAWARAPESFIVSDAAPAGAGGGGMGMAKKRAIQKGSADAAELMKRGVEQVGTLVRELGVSGVAALGADRVDQMETVAAGLRENRLRRLSARTLDLTVLLRVSALDPAGPRGLPPVPYTNLMADLLLTARKLEKHLAGEPLDDRHVEELIGKTWQKGDRKPIEGLDLIEVAFGTWTTSDEYLISESRFFDLASGRHYSEKLILPAFLAKTQTKRSHGGQVLGGARGTTYPGYPPSRVEFSDLGDRRPLDADALATLVEKALPDVGAALAALHEQRKDVFAPDLVPVAVRIDTLFARGARLQAVDDKGHALHLPADAALEERLAGSLREARLRALIGDVGIDAALPTLWPLAAVIEGPLGLELRPVLEPGATRGQVWTPQDPLAGSAWGIAAREAGASTAAVALGEVREELAEAFLTGLTGLSARVTDPLADRLRGLGLEKQAALLQGLVKKTEAAERLDDFIKLYQVLEIALVRLAGATHVDRATMERVPTYESVYVGPPEEKLSPAEVTKRRAAGTMNRYLAAIHYARYYEALPAEELVANIFPIWADGSAGPFIARTFAARGAEALRAAEKALTVKAGRVAKQTAVRVLQAVAAHGGATEAEAEAMLGKVAKHSQDAGLRALALDALDGLDVQRSGGAAVRERRSASLQKVQDLATKLRMAPQKDERRGTLKELVELGDLAALPALRQAFYADASRAVREEAAYALGQLGDPEMVETFVRMLSRRGEDDREAKIAAYALGYLGDVRGLDELLSAYAEGYKPAIVSDAIRAFGPVALDPLLDLLEARPELAKRATALDVLKKMEDTAVAERLLQRLEAQRERADLAEVAQLYLKLAEVHPHSKREVARAVQARFGAAEGKDAQAAVKAAQRALGVVKGRRTPSSDPP